MALFVGSLFHLLGRDMNEKIAESTQKYPNSHDLIARSTRPGTLDDDPLARSLLPSHQRRLGKPSKAPPITASRSATSSYQLEWDNGRSGRQARKGCWARERWCKVDSGLGKGCVCGGHA